MRDTDAVIEMDRRSLLSASGGTAAAAALPAPTPLRRLARGAGLLFGSSLATWQLDADYRRVHARECDVLLTEDDLLWSRIRPHPGAPLDLDRGDRIVGLAERHGQLAIGAHLLWDEGYGAGWTYDDIAELPRHRAARLLYATIAAEVRHFRGRVGAWVVANEVTDPSDGDRHGLRRSTPWYRALGPGHVAEAFHVAAEHDPHAVRILNEFGFETRDLDGADPRARRRAFLTAVDHLLDRGAPLQAVGLQAHLVAAGFADGFHERAYRDFLGELADRGLLLVVSELDVLDTRLPTDARRRDRLVADVYRRYLDVTLDEPAVKAVVTFGLTDRYSWLDEDQPRRDGTHRRGLLLDRRLRAKAARDAVATALRRAPARGRWQQHRPTSPGRGSEDYGHR